MSQAHLITRIAALALLGGGLAACSDGKSNRPNPGPAPTDPGNVFVVTSANRVLSFQLETPRVVRTAVAVTGLAAGETILDTDTRPAGALANPAVRNMVYALGSSGTLYTLNPTTGAATAVAGTPLTLDPDASYGIDFNPLPDRVRVVSSAGDNLRVNPTNTAMVTTDTDLSLDGAPALNISDVAYSNSFPDGCTTQLFYIDTATDTLLTTALPNAGVLSEVGSLGVDASAVTGFDLIGTSTVALAVMTVGGTAGVYFIDTATGAASLRDTLAGLNAGETPVGLAGTIKDDVMPPGDMVAVTQTNRLISFNRADPSRTCTAVDLFALDANDDPVDAPAVVGIDLRPSDGQLYGLAEDGSVLLIDSSGETAVVQAALMSSNGATPPVLSPVALDGTSFGVDFNPVPDRLRVVSNTGQNLRINVDAAEDAFNVTVDAPLSQTNVSGAAYTNSEIGADPAPTTTTLYYVDVNADQLLTTTSPNDGVLTVVGPLGVDIDSLNGFDIEGSSGTAFLASNVAAGTGALLYSVNIGSGAAMQLGTTTIGAGSTAGAELIRGLAATGN